MKQLRACIAWIRPLLILLVHSDAFAFDGRVLLPGGAPAAGATVSILGHSGSTLTDQNGRFTWAPDPTPPFEVIVVLAGGEYMTPVPVEALPSKGEAIDLLVSSFVETVKVTSGAAPHTSSAPANAQTLITHADLAERAPMRVAQALEYIPGATRSGLGHDAVPSLRGLARGRTVMLIDGARVTTERRAGPSATYLDPFFLEGIEVSRGPGSVAYGSDALGGVIHVRTRRPEPGAGTQLRAVALGGVGIPERGFGAEWIEGFGSTGLLFQGRWREFDDYSSPEGEVFNSSAEDWGFLARLSQTLGDGLLSVGIQRDAGRDIGKASATSYLTQIFYPEEDSQRLTASWEATPQAGFTRLGIEGFFGTYQLVTEQHRLPVEGQTERIALADVDANDFGLRAYAAHPWMSGRIEAGLDVSGRYGLEALGDREEFDADGDLVSHTEEVSVEDARRLDAALYAAGDWRLWSSPLVASAGVRGGVITTENEGGFVGDWSTSTGAYAGFAALAVEAPRGLTVTGQVARGFRDPTLSDRYFRGISGRGFVTGNPDLESESTLQWDIACRYTVRRTRIALYGYRYEIDDLVERYEESPDMFTFRNRGRGLIKGGEIEVQSDLGRGFLIEFGGQTARGNALADSVSPEDTPLADIPEDRLTLMLAKSWREHGWASVRVASHALDEHPGPAEIITPGYTTVDLGGGVRISSVLDARLYVRNVLDHVYLASPDEDTVTAPGWSATLSLTMSWGK